MICLQLKSLLADRGALELDPEELFSELPAGEERALVASILTDLSADDDPEASGSSDQLDEVLKWLDRQRLKRRSEELMHKIREAESLKDASLLNALLLEKMRVDGDLKNS